MSKPGSGPVIGWMVSAGLMRQTKHERTFHMLTCIVHHANGVRETVDIEIIDAGSASRFADVSGAEAEVYKPAAPLGAKRLPQVGEVWRNRGGALVAVMSAATVLDGGYNVVTLSRSDTARNPGHVYLVDLDGHIHRDHSGAPGDLVTAVTRFDS